MEQNPKKLKNTLKCEVCGSKFECEIANGKNKCWCFDYPNILPIKSNKCICRKCIEEKINDKNG